MIYLEVGDTLHVARHLQHHAGPDTILVSAATARHTRGEVQLEALEPVLLPGASAPVDVYKLLGVAHQRLPLAQPSRRLLSPFVGQAREIALLNERLQQAIHGRGQVVSLVGEAGLGKSRLVSEVSLRWAKSGVAFLTTACQPYGQTIPYLPVRELLRHHLKITPATPADDVTATIRQTLAAVGPDADTMAPDFLALLGMPTAEAVQAAPSPEALRAPLHRDPPTALRQCAAPAARPDP
ncbi:MAG TPA: AAA family ATPase [Alphaproteobacteria bacterium]|nr:AAA family ATPase [Alphaproteobacteria bacterium]